MMPPPHMSNTKRNRVENIKKKFEDINKFVPVSDNLNNRPNLAHKSRLGRSGDPQSTELRCKVDSPKKPKLAADVDSCFEFTNNNNTSTKAYGASHPVLERQLSSPTSRGHIRRSPAFRCDRIVKGRNVLSPAVGHGDRGKSVIDKRVEQFDCSNEELVSAKPCNAILAEQRNPNNSSSSPTRRNNVAERARAFTAPTDKFNHTAKLPLDLEKAAEKGGPAEAKRNKLELDKGIGLSLKNTNVVNHSGGWLHSRPGNDPKQSSVNVSSNSQAQNQFCENVPMKNLLSEVKLKKIGKDIPSPEKPGQGSKSDGNVTFRANISRSPPKQQSLLHSDGGEKATGTQSGRREGTYQPGLTDTLKAALKAPLPFGPPPKKPPRTFAHNSPTPMTVSSNTSAMVKSAVTPASHNPVSPPPFVRSKTESQIMLHKIESALLNHKASTAEVNSSSPEERKGSLRNRLGSLSPPGTILNSPGHPLSPNSGQNYSKSHPTAINNGCLTSTNCAIGKSTFAQQPRNSNQDTKSGPQDFVPDPNMKRKSSLQDTSPGGQQKVQSSLLKSHSVEHIYAEPFQFIGDGSRICKSKDCEANFRHPPPTRDTSKPMFHPKRILQASPEQVFRARLASPIESNPEGLHYLCTPIQENSPQSFSELQMTSLPLRLSPPPVEATNHELFRRPSRECLSLEMPQQHNATSPSTQKMALKRSPAEKEKVAKDMTDGNLNSTKIKFLMNQAFGSPLQCLPATPLDSNSDTDSVASTPDEGVSLAPFPGVPCPPTQQLHKEVIRPSCPPPDVPEAASPSKESLQQLTAERRTYVRRVSSHVMGQRSLRLVSQPSKDNFNHLFECLLLVGLNLDPDRPKCKVPYIKSKFPLEVEVPPHIESLCFPDAGEWPPPACTSSSGESVIPGEEQCYSLVITSDSGERKYGYCRRVQPEGAPICLPLAYCILTPHRASGFYFKILAELESRHGEPEIQQSEFIQQLYDCSFPNPGLGLRVNGSGQQLSVGCTGTASSTSSSNSSSMGSGSKGRVVVRRPYDTRLEERDLTRLFNSLQISIFLQVFSSLLLERKVLLLSKSISKLSSCVEALQSILYPFVWQHTFIPVLPTSMLEICQAPTPYVIGVLKGRHPILPPVSIDHGIVVDVDNSLILQSQQDETTILPIGISRSLKVALQLAQNSTLHDHPSRNVLVSEAFLRTFVEVCGHYQTHIVVQQDGKRVFEKESFIKAVRSRSIQMFLEWFTETAMFSTFIEARLDKPDETKGMFEQRVAEHHEEREKNTLLYLKNYKGLNKKVKTLGDRFKDWTPFS